MTLFMESLMEAVALLLEFFDRGSIMESQVFSGQA